MFEFSDDEFNILPVSEYDEANSSKAETSHYKSGINRKLREGIGDFCEVVLTELDPDSTDEEEQSMQLESCSSNQLPKAKPYKKSTFRVKPVGVRITRNKSTTNNSTEDETSKKEVTKDAWPSSRRNTRSLNSKCDSESNSSAGEPAVSTEGSQTSHETNDNEADWEVPPVPIKKPKLRYSCDECDFSFGLEYELQRHKKFHSKDRPHKCKECDSAFTTKKGLKDHNNRHKGIKPFKCDECEATFSCRSNMKLHKKTHTGEKPHQCAYCGFRSSNKPSLLIHERRHTNERPFACDECDMKFRLSHHLRQHKLIHSGEKPFLCSVCGKKSRQLAQHLSHIKIHEGSTNFKCDKCGLCFKTVRILRNHQFSMHNDKGPNIWECSDCSLIYYKKVSYLSHRQTHKKNSTDHQCEVCGLQCRSTAVLRQHSMTHTGEKPFKCSFCSYACTLKTGLQQHERIHTGEKPYQCDTCGVAFRLKSHLKQHILIHIDARPFKCEQCSKAFRQMAALQLHKQTHTDEKPFSCDECDLSFRLKKELNKHKILHLTDDPFECDICGSVFRLNIHLKQHMKSHLDLPKSFECDICGSAFRQKTHLTQHYKSHSNEKPFKCQQCPSAFRVRANLKRHELGHKKKNNNSTLASLTRGKSTVGDNVTVNKEGTCGVGDPTLLLNNRFQGSYQSFINNHSYREGSSLQECKVDDLGNKSDIQTGDGHVRVDENWASTNPSPEVDYH